MKKYISRKEVAELLVSDGYYAKGHWLLKVWQTFVGIIGWAAVTIPFIWIFSPIFFKGTAQKYSLFSYPEEIETLLFLLVFLIIAFFVILVLYVSLTLWNNYRFKHFLQKKKLYDEERLERRRQLLDEEFTERFGPKEERETICFYSVKEEQNLDNDFVTKLYKERDVEL